MSRSKLIQAQQQSLAIDEFLYFFLRLRKGEIRRTVQALKRRYPDDSQEQLARRLISSKAALSLVGGSLIHLPLLFPGIGQALKLLGVVGATSLLTRMHLYLILEIALVYGKDIDDRARIPEMMAVVAATGLSAASPLLVRVLELHPYYASPAGGLSAAATARLIGQSAVKFYSRTPGKARSAIAGT
jgi:hypothetical protein